MPNDPSPIETAAALLIDAAGLARLLSVSAKTVRRMDSAGKLPRPLRLSSGCVRWSRATVERWVAEGCPDRRTFEAISAGAGGSPTAGRRPKSSA